MSLESKDPAEDSFSDEIRKILVKKKMSDHEHDFLEQYKKEMRMVSLMSCCWWAS